MSLKQIFLKAPYKVQNSQNIGVCGSVLTCKMHCLGNDDIITSICACPLLFCVISMRLKRQQQQQQQQQRWTTDLFTFG